MDQTILNDYNRRATIAQQEIDKYSKLINQYSLYRLIVFGLLAAAIYVSVKTSGLGLLIFLLIILLICFVWLVARQSIFEAQKDYYTALKAVIENESDSIRNRSNIYDNGDEFINEKHPYSADLDIFGKASLFQLISRAATSAGKGLLAGWLSAHSEKEIILIRQHAVKELASKHEWKLDFQARLLFAKESNAARIDELFRFLALPFKLAGEKWLRPYIKLSPFLLLTAIITGYFFSYLYFVAIIIAVFNLGILIKNGTLIERSGLVADKIGQTLAKYAIVFETIEKAEWQSVKCHELREQLRSDNASQQIKELSKLINKLNYSLIMIVGFLLNIFMLWALKQIIAIEDWKRKNRSNLKEAFDVVAEFETLISLASLHINYPDWCFPEIVVGDKYTLTAKQIGHPLIHVESRKYNDYILNNERKIDIITGSNMAGKSTFLRTIGINAVLALCGAPVCAQAMKISVITIISYMRIKDSLNESTSTFKAELDRLKMLLSAVEEQHNVYFLIDEMLRGTNSADKYHGSKAVIERLIHQQGVGLVATHDLQLADMEQAYPNYIRNFYFDIQVQDGEMLFDYQIKHGACKTFNASLLLKQIGIEVKG